MKKYFLILSCILVIASCKTRTDDQGTKDVTINQGAVVRMDISVKGMTCTGCENTIKEGVSELPGVMDVTASFKDGKATVRYDSTLTNPEAIAKVIGKRGYEVTGYNSSDLFE